MGLFSFFGTHYPARDKRIQEKSVEPEQDITGHFMLIDSWEFMKPFPIEECLNGNHDEWMSGKDKEWFEEEGIYTSIRELVQDQLERPAGGKCAGSRYILELVDNLNTIYPEIVAGHFHQTIKKALDFNLVTLLIRRNKLTPENIDKISQTKKDFRPPRPK